MTPTASLPMRHRPRTATLAAALLGLALGACGGTLYDPLQIPKVSTGPGQVCTAATQHACVVNSVSTCEDNTDPNFCGTACEVCPVSPANGARACTPGGGGVYGCSYTCDPGFFACPSGCCRATAVAAGGNHACAITSAASLVCWGANDAGQLGPAAGTSASSTSPVQVLDAGVTLVAVGGHHTCALQAGAVKCWGANDQGQSGHAGAGSATPSQVSITGTLTALAAGSRHTCAVAGGAVKCWGDNRVGQLGDGTTTSSTSAVTPVASGASAVSALTDTTCAVVGTGASCWGANASGQVGNGGSVTPQTTPQTLAFPAGALSPVLAVFTGDDHACALLPADSGKVNGGLFCWGTNASNQLGVDPKTPVTSSFNPIRAGKIDNGGNAFIAATGASFSCAGRDPANLVCAGLNDQAQTGSPAGPPQTESPVSLGGNLIAASAGLDHTCALVDETPPPAPASSPVVKCWGRNAEGQLGFATASGAPSASPGVVGQ